MHRAADHRTVRLADEIANQVALYENAWRTSDTPAMRAHWRQLEQLCHGDLHAQLIRGACVIAAAGTRDTDCGEAGQRKVDHLRSPRERDALIREYLAGTQDTTEEFGAVA